MMGCLPACLPACLQEKDQALDAFRKTFQDKEATCQVCAWPQGRALHRLQLAAPGRARRRYPLHLLPHGVCECSCLRPSSAPSSTARALLQVHCLGFSPDHDAAFLSALTLSGTAQGSFHYVEDPALQLKPALGAVQQVGVLLVQ
jgi:hypothetical protein